MLVTNTLKHVFILFLGYSKIHVIKNKLIIIKKMVLRCIDKVECNLLCNKKILLKIKLMVYYFENWFVTSIQIYKPYIKINKIQTCFFNLFMEYKKWLKLSQK